jgi:hypothetical protein
MYDAALSDICGTQVWQRVHLKKAVLSDVWGINDELYRKVGREELDKAAGMPSQEALSQANSNWPIRHLTI